MKILIVSHNVFSQTQSMGKTLCGYFSGFQPEELAQFYIHSQVPTLDICRNYYRMTDKDAVKSIFGIPCGTRYQLEDIEFEGEASRTNQGIEAFLYQKARERTPLIYIVRNTWWKLSHWNNRRFRKWLDAFNPDCVFFASGDYAFMYDIARKIAMDRGIPLYVSCMDNYYTYNKNSGSVLGRFQYRLFMKSVRKTMDYATAIFGICDEMCEEYTAMFHRECVTIHTPSAIKEPIQVKKQPKITYLGNLSLGRNKQLAAIGCALKKLGLKPDHIDVYSSESRPEVLVQMTEENGICFHGAVSAEEVRTIIGESLATIHTESFDDPFRKTVRYSISTKIADSLASGTCIFAYGPEEVASISYLERNHAAICCTNEKELEEKLRRLIEDVNLRSLTVENALRLSEKNHMLQRTPAIIRMKLYENSASQLRLPKRQHRKNYI